MCTDDNLLFIQNTVVYRRNEVTKRLASSCSCLDHQMLTISERTVHLLNHLLLAFAFLISLEFILQLRLEFMIEINKSTLTLSIFRRNIRMELVIFIVPVIDFKVELSIIMI